VPLEQRETFCGTIIYGQQIVIDAAPPQKIGHVKNRVFWHISRTRLLQTLRP
jgi:hypothetical protein